MTYLFIGLLISAGISAIGFILAMCKAASKSMVEVEETMESIKHLPLWQQEQILDQRENCRQWLEETAVEITSDDAASEDTSK